MMDSSASSPIVIAGAIDYAVPLVDVVVLQVAVIFASHWPSAAVPEFPGLRRFPDGRDFNQWTGDDSKALMKVRDDICLFCLP